MKQRVRLVVPIRRGWKARGGRCENSLAFLLKTLSLSLYLSLHLPFSLAGISLNVRARWDGPENVFAETSS